MGGLESKASSMGGAVAAAGGTLAALSAGAMVAATKSAYNFESAMADVEKVTSGDTAAALEGKIMDLASTIPVARDELVTLAEQAGKFGVEGPENIEKFVSTVGKIGAATDMAAEEAGTRFAKIAGAVGMPMDEIDKLGNATNKLADSFKTDAGEVTDTANRTANILSQQLGIGADATLALSASMNEVAPSSRKAAGALTSAAEAMLDPKKVGDVSAALGMTKDEFKKMRDEDPHGLMQTIAKAMDEGGESADELRSAVGNRASRAFAALGANADRTEEALGTVNDQFENGTSLTEEMAIRTGTAAGQWQLFQNKVQNAATTTGGNFLPIVKNVLGALNGLIDTLGAVNQKTDGMAGALTLAAGLAAGLTAAVGGTVAVLGTSATAMAGLTGAAGALGTAFTVLTGPIGIAIAAVAALYMAYEKNLFGMKDVVDSVIGSVRGTIDRNVGPIMEKLGRVADLVLEYINPAIETLRPVFEETFGAISQVVNAAMQAIGGYITYSFDAIFTTINATLSLILGDTDEAMMLMEGLIDRTLGKLVSWFRNWPLAQALGETVYDALETFEETVNQLPGVQLDITDQMESIVRNSDVAKEHERNARESASNIKRGGRDMAQRTQSAVGEQESAVASSGIPDEFKNQYGKAATEQSTALDGMEQEHGQSMADLTQRTRDSELPEAMREKLAATEREQQKKTDSMVQNHNGMTTGITQETGGWTMPNEYSDKYSAAETAQSDAVGNMETEHAEGLGGMQTDTQEWGMPDKMGNRMGAAFEKLANAMQEMTMRLEQALGGMQSSTKSWGLPGAMQTPMGNTTGVVRSEGDSMESEMASSLGAIQRDASGIETAARGAQDVATAAARSAAQALSRARRNAGKASSVARSAGSRRGTRDEGLTKMHTGGYVGATGAALLKKGEYVLSESDVERGAKPSSGGSGGADSGDISVEAPITIEGNADEDAVEQIQREFDRLVSEIERLQGRSTT